MIREIVVPENNTYLLKLPDEMVGKPVEVIAFEVNVKSFNEKSKTKDKQQRIKDIQKIFDDCRVDLSSFKFNREDANNYDE